MNLPVLPYADIPVPERLRPAAEKARTVLVVLGYAAWVPAIWLLAIGQWKLFLVGLLGAAVMPFLARTLMLPADWLKRRGSAAGTAVVFAVLGAWTWAAAAPVLEREELPLLLRLLWANSVACLPVSLFAIDEDAYVPLLGLLQVQFGVLWLCAAEPNFLPHSYEKAVLAALAVAATGAAYAARTSAKR